MSARARLLVLFGLLSGAQLVSAVAAHADLFGPISLASVGTTGGGHAQQAEFAHDAAISGNGQYVVFDGSIGGVIGVWRRDLSTDTIEQVAGGNAELPSVSESGQYISFTTNEPLEQVVLHANGLPDPETRETHQPPNVYVRDMGRGPSESGAFVLASAVNGGTQALSYEYLGTAGSPLRASEEEHLGSVAAGRSAIDAQGNEVAFVTTTMSDLAGPHTPALQVAVRYLDTHQTKLVSGESHEGRTTETPVSEEGFGAVYPGSTRAVGFSPIPADAYWGDDPPPGASISADGTTVAWMGEDISKQAQMLPGERTSPLYTEPLWRRVAPGSETSTERVTGGSVPDSPGCAVSGERKLPERPAEQTSSDPCQGPFEVGFNTEGLSRGIWSETGGGGESDFVPRLSADGYEVAFASSAVPIARGLAFSEGEGQQADLYVADMHTGLTRAQALTALTEVGGANVAADSPVTDFDISASGKQVAFTSRRSVFSLGLPAYVSAPLAEPGESELFEVDLEDDTLTRVTHGYNGEPSEQAHGSALGCQEAEDVYCNPITIGSQSPSFSADGYLIGFSSTSSNLVYGDGNSSRTPSGTPEGQVDGSDAFLVKRQPVVVLPTPQYISPGPTTVSTPLWRLSATALSRSDGSVLLYVSVPGLGVLRAGAQGSVLGRLSANQDSKSHTRRARKTVAARTVATATRPIPAGQGEVVQLPLKLTKSYAQLASRKGGLSASVNLTFTAPSHTVLRQSIQVTFLRKGRAAHKGHSSGHRKAAG